MNNHRKEWITEHEINLRMWWAVGLFAYKIADKLGRTPKAISSKVKELNLPPRRKPPSIPLMKMPFRMP